MSYIKITPSPSTTLINKVYIVAVRAELYKNATVSVDLFSSDKFVRNELIALTDEEYNAWNVDEDIENLVLLKLGFEKAPVVEPVETLSPVVEPVVDEEKKEEP